MHDIRFRAWDKKEKTMNYSEEGRIVDGRLIAFDLMIEWRRNIYSSEWELMQFTGLHDKNGTEVYEFMELDGKWEVDWLNGKYILRDISNGDIIDLNYENKYEITRDYTKI